MEIRIIEQITSQCTTHMLSSTYFTSFHANIQTNPNKANIRHSPYTSKISNTHTHTLYSTTKQTARNPCCNHHITTNHHNNCAREYCPYQQQQYIYKATMKLTIASTLLASALAFAPSPQFGIVSILKPLTDVYIGFQCSFVVRTHAGSQYIFVRRARR